MFYDQELIVSIKEANLIEEVVDHYIPLKNYKGICPWHDDHNPSFHVSRQKQIGKCFVCMDKAVDVFGFIMRMENLSFIEAVRFLADRKGIKLPDLTEEDRQELEKQKRREQLLAEVIKFYANQLLSRLGIGGDIEYFKVKGISTEIAKQFQLGLAFDGGLLEYLINQDFSEEECFESGVVTVRSGKVEDFFINAVIFPIVVRGRAVSLTGRMLSDEAPSKFMHLKGEISYLYNEDALYGADEVIICEGPVDTITAVQYGYTAVGVLGSQAFKEGYLSKFSGIKKIYACLDNDEGGRLGMKRLDEIFRGNIKMIKLPEGMDLNDYFNK